MSLEIPFKIKPLNPTSNFDERYGPHLNLTNALIATEDTREKGTTVGVLNGSGQVDEYWFKSGILDSDLVLKNQGGSGGSYTFTNGIKENSGTVSLGGNIGQDTLLTLQSNVTNNLNFTILDSFSDVKLNLNADHNGSGSSLISLEAKYDLNFQNNLAYSKLNRTSTVLSNSVGVSINNSLVELSFTYSQASGETSAYFRDDLNLRGLEYPADYSSNFRDHSLVTKKWVTDNLLIPFSLQETTDEGNFTDNILQITGNNNVDLNKNGIILNYISGNQNGGISLVYDGGIKSYLHLREETSSYASASFSGRVSGLPAINGEDFITLDQLDAEISDVDLQFVTNRGNSTTKSIIAAGFYANQYVNSDLYTIRHSSSGNTAIIGTGAGTTAHTALLTELSSDGTWRLKADDADTVLYIYGSGKRALGVIGRAFGQDAINNDEFVTLSQLNSATQLGLQDVTDQGNSTSNAIQVTGANNLNPSLDGLWMAYTYDTKESVLFSSTDGVIGASLDLRDNNFSLVTGGDSSEHLRFDGVEDQGRFVFQWVPSLAKARIAIGDATALDEAVTLSQLNAVEEDLTLTFSNGLRKDENGNVKLGLDLSTVGTTYVGSLSEDTILFRGNDLVNYSQIGIGQNSLQFVRTINSFQQAIQFATIGHFITITDGINNKGLQYNSDYSTNGILDDRWIPDWGAVKNLLSLTNLTGDVTGTISGNEIATTITNGAVTYNKMQSIPQNTIIGRVLSGVGVSKALSVSETRTMLQINNVNNTSDANKPISTATQSALDLKVDKSSVGQANGVASLNSSGTLPANQSTLFNDILSISNVTSNDIEITDNTKGMILTSPNGSRWRITIDNSGVLQQTVI